MHLVQEIDRRHSLGCCSCTGLLLSGLSCVCTCDSGSVEVSLLECGECPLAQVTMQNPVERLAQADSRISLSVEHRAVFCSSSNKYQGESYETNIVTKP